MKTLRPAFALMALAIAFMIVWLLLPNDSSSLLINSADINSDISKSDTTSIQRPDSNPLVKPETFDEVAELGVTGKPATVLDTAGVDFEPDYGPLLLRGGGVVSFELFDANKNRVKLTSEKVGLCRIFGEKSILDVCYVDAKLNRIVCNGLGGSQKRSAGLEPGEYELTMLSRRWGNIRQRFHVNRGEQRIERLQSERYLRTICFYFIDQNGKPIDWIYGWADVGTQTEALPAVKYGTPRERFLKTRPDSASMGGGKAWRSSRPPSMPRSLRAVRSSRRATDDGRYYVTVWAGATNTVRFAFDKDIWGVSEYTVTDTFTDSRWELHQVTLTLPKDFQERVEKLRFYRSARPGNKPDVAVQNELELPEFQPETAPIGYGYGRLVVTLIGPEGLVPKAETHRANRGSRLKFKFANGHWYCDCPIDGRTKVRAEGNGYVSEWQDVTLADGQITYAQVDATPTIINIDTSELSPTLNAAALVLELQLNKYKSDGDKTSHPDSRTDDSKWNAVPRGMSFIERCRFKKTEGLNGFCQYFNPTDPFQGNVFDSFGYRTILRTASGYRKSSGSATRMANGRMYFSPITLKAPWRYAKGDGQSLLQMLQDGEVKPAIDGVLALRAVGDNQEGLPWVQGLLMPLEEEELALAVKTRMESTTDGSIPDMDNAVIETYAAKIAELEVTEDAEQAKIMKALIGEDAYNLFENDKQRIWFAKNASWYNSSMKVSSDIHGYILTRQHKLEEGKSYVLYLWSNSRDQMKPDKRIVFKAGKDNSDLGVIRLPSYR